MIFISYARENHNLAEKLRLSLQQSGFDCWMDTERIVAGDTWSDQIEKALKQSTIMVVIMTNAAADPNSFVREELRYAKHIRKNLIRIFSIITDITEENIPLEVANLQQIRRETFDEAMAQLLKELTRSGVQSSIIEGQCKILNEYLVKNTDDLTVIGRFEKTRQVVIKEVITEGNSGSKVFWVDATARATNKGTSPHFLKIHNSRNGDQPRIRHELAFETKIGSFMPELVDYTPRDEKSGRIALLYALTGNKRYRSLDNLMQKNVLHAVGLIDQTCEALVAWNEAKFSTNSRVDSLPVLLRQGLNHSLDPGVAERRLFDPTDSVQARLKELCQLDVESPVVVFERDGRRLPNPLAYLMRSSLWGQEEHRQITWPHGHIHGDLNVRNILEIPHKTDNALSLIDFDTYDPDNLIFIDFAYLEIAVILPIIVRLCNPNLPDNQVELISLSKYLVSGSDLELQEGIPNELGFVSTGINNLLLPIRRTVASLCSHHPDYELAFWVARAAAGIEMSRKARALRPERITALLLAADSLNRLIQELGGEMAEGATTSIKWIDQPKEGKD